MEERQIELIISIIICTYNRGRYIYGLLESIAKNAFDTAKYEIIFVNNKSTDNTELECKRFQQDYPDVVFHYFMEENQGLSFARNRGIKESQGKMLVFIDDDALVNNQYLSNLEKHILQTDISAFGGKITPKYEAEAPNWVSSWSLSWFSSIDMGDKVKLFQKGKFPIGANMGISKELASRIAPFDTNLGRNKGNMIGGEEKEYFLRIQRNGTPIYYLPDVQIEHCIPKERTTRQFIKKQALGIGKSEQIRTKSISSIKYLQRIFAEFIKWGVTILLFFYYTITLSPMKGWMLIYFRWNVSKGLLGC